MLCLGELHSSAHLWKLCSPPFPPLSPDLSTVAVQNWASEEANAKKSKCLFLKSTFWEPYAIPWRLAYWHSATVCSTLLSCWKSYLIKQYKHLAQVRSSKIVLSADERRGDIPSSKISHVWFYFSVPHVSLDNLHALQLHLMQCCVSSLSLSCLFPFPPAYSLRHLWNVRPPLMMPLPQSLITPHLCGQFKACLHFPYYGALL